METHQCSYDVCRLRKPASQMFQFGGKWWCSENHRVSQLQRDMAKVPKNILHIDKLDRPDGNFRPTFHYEKGRQFRVASRD